MKGKTEKATVTKPSLTNSELELSADAELKVLHIWQAFDQMYGKRWADNFGNDPIGKINPESRMTQWIEAAKGISWTALKETIIRVRNNPKPYDGWLPDLQAFMGFCPKVQRIIEKVSAAAPTEVDIKCHVFLLRFSLRCPILVSKDLERDLRATMNDLRLKYNLVATEDPTLTEKDYLPVLAKKLTAVVQKHQKLLGSSAGKAD